MLNGIKELRVQRKGEIGGSFSFIFTSPFWIINQVKEMAITRIVVKFAEGKTGSLTEQMTEKRILPEILQGYSRTWGKI